MIDEDAAWSLAAHAQPGYATYADTPARNPTSPYRPPRRPGQAAINLMRHLDLPVEPWQEQVIDRVMDERVCPAGHRGPLPPMPDDAYPPGAEPLAVWLDETAEWRARQNGKTSWLRRLISRIRQWTPDHPKGR